MKSQFKSVLAELDKTPLMPKSFSSPGMDQVLHGTYRITRRIARGGMGVVYEAEHLRLTDKKVAVKMLKPDALEDRHGFARFVREAYLVSSLGHPHIVYILDFNILDSGQPYIVMELLEGENLQARLRRHDNVLPLADVTRIMKQAGSALHVLHDRGVVHRDLKPSNMFLLSGTGEQIHLKLIDFGISKTWSSGVTEVMTVVGSPYFMSPEQARGEVAQIDQRTDIFCLATVAYLCLCGVHPFSAPTLSEVRRKILTHRPALVSEKNPDLPAGVGQVLARAMAKAKEDRYADVRQLVEEFCAAAAEPEPEPAPVEDDKVTPVPDDSTTAASVTSIMGASTHFDAAKTALVESPPSDPAPSRSGDTVVSAGREESGPDRAGRPHRRLLLTLLAVAAGAALVLGLLFGMGLAPRSPDADRIPEPETPGAVLAGEEETRTGEDLGRREEPLVAGAPSGLADAGSLPDAARSRSVVVKRPPPRKRRIERSKRKRPRRRRKVVPPRSPPKKIWRFDEL